jgi:hypothetical protein
MLRTLRACPSTLLLLTLSAAVFRLNTNSIGNFSPSVVLLAAILFALSKLQVRYEEVRFRGIDGRIHDLTRTQVTFGFRDRDEDNNDT